MESTGLDSSQADHPAVGAPRETARRRTMQRRKWATILALPLGLVLTDLCVGWFYLDSADYMGPPIPPFTIRDNPRLAEWFEMELEARREGKPGARSKTMFDSELGWTNPPRKASKDRETYLPEINSIGARGAREYEAQIPEGVVRLCCFGDSFVYGSEVLDGEDFAARVEAMEPKLEVVNFGVAGYGLDQSLLRFRRKSAELDSDVVVIGFQAGTLPRVVTRCRSIEFPLASILLVKPRFRLRAGNLELVPLPFADGDEFFACALNGELEETLREHEYWAGDDPLIPFSNIARMRAARTALERRDYHELWKKPREEPFKVFTKVLLKFREEALAAGAKEVLVLVFPHVKDFDRRGPEGAHYLGRLRSFLKTNEFEVLNFDQRFSHLMTRDRTAMFMRHHLNPKANGMVADALLEWTRSRPGLGLSCGADD